MPDDIFLEDARRLRRSEVKCATRSSDCLHVMKQRSDTIRAVKERLNLADIARRYMELKRNGTRWTACCPFHGETKPSFSINEEEGFFYCFGCQVSGDIFDFYSKINGLDFQETLEQLAAEAGITLDPRRDTGQERTREKERGERRRMLAVYEFAAGHYAQNLHAKGATSCLEYMERRGIDKEAAERFGLGYALPEWGDLAKALHRGGFDEAFAVRAGLLAVNGEGRRAYDRFRGRLIFPIHNLSRQVIAFGGRIIDGKENEAKYINSSDSPIYKKGDHLYALPRARAAVAAQDRVLLTEGYMDVLTLHQFGYENAVGVLGTAFTPEQAKRLSAFTSHVLLLFDGDAAGRKAARRACEMLLPRGFHCRVVLLPQGEDIDSLLRSEGKECFELLMQTAPEGLRFCLDTVRRDMAPREAVVWARDFLKGFAELPELYSRFASETARGLSLAEEELRGHAPVKTGKTLPFRGSRPSDGPDAVFEREILRFAVRYPHRCPDLRGADADFFLKSTVGRALWAKFFAYSVEELAYCLDEREKAFWRQCREGEAPPLDNEEEELAALLKKLAARHKKKAIGSVSAALREAAGVDDFAGDMEYITALRKPQGTDDEQS